MNHDGIDVNIKNNNGATALMRASCHGKLDVVCALLNHGGIDLISRINMATQRSALQAEGAVWTLCVRWTTIELM